MCLKINKVNSTCFVQTTDDPLVFVARQLVFYCRCQASDPAHGTAAETPDRFISGKNLQVEQYRSIRLMDPK